MKNLVIFCSVTGSTRKLAEAISDELDCAIYDLRANMIAGVDLKEVESIFIGSGVYGGLLHKRVMALTKEDEFIKALKNNIRSIGIFSTYAFVPDSSESAVKKFEEALPSEIQNKIEKYFCRGGLFGLFGRKRPLPEDVRACEKWARKMTD
ncbi:MAG TPA: flavodoxin domain-containing protein [Thermotogota bacterium]|nr:flavodoxin domain-containing protein [Thermotogota bacterium]